MVRFFKKYKLNIILLVLLLFTLPLFFYKLGDSTLANWDEAWYAEIARNIVRSGNLFVLTWNGQYYADHPPAGFWLIALVFKLFGINEFWARFIPAVSGFFSIILIYFLGKTLFNRYIGFISSLALTSATWFLFRARSGNLDIILTMFFLLSVFLALKVSSDKRYLIPLAFCLMMLFLSKSLVPFTILPVLFVIFFRSPALKKFKLRDLILPGIIFLTPIAIWFIVQTIKEQTFINHYFKIGFPGGNINTSFGETLGLYKQYLHNGIGKWFWPGVLSLIGGLALFRTKSLPRSASAAFYYRGFLILFTFFTTFSLPFLFSREGQIWHLIPLYPFMILACFGFGYIMVEWVTKQKILAVFAISLFGFYFWFPQTRQNWQQFININAFVSDEAILSRESAKYPYRLYIDGDFYPVAVFYSEKNVQQIWFNALPTIFAEVEPFLLITKQERLDGAKIPKSAYEVIKTDRDKTLILKTSSTTP